MCAKVYQNGVMFDKVIKKIICCSFFAPICLFQRTVQFFQVILDDR